MFVLFYQIDSIYRDTRVALLFIFFKFCQLLELALAVPKTKPKPRPDQIFTIICAATVWLGFAFELIRLLNVFILRIYFLFMSFLCAMSSLMIRTDHS